MASSSEILGEWDVVSFEGYRPQRRISGTTRAAFADFRNDGVGLRIECNWSGAQGQVRDGRWIPAQDGPVPQTLMGCGAEREARDARYFAFFGRSPQVELLADGRLRLTAGEDQLLLERPAQRRLAFLPEASELQGKWRMLELTFYHPEGGMSGMGLSEVPGRIVFDGDSLGYSRCPQYDLAFRLSDAGVLEKTAGPAVPDQPAGCEELSAFSYRRQPPELWNVLTLLHDDPTVERVGGGLLVSNDRYGLLLTQEPCESVEQSEDHLTTTVRDCASPE